VSNEIIFATSNSHKVFEAGTILAEFGIKVRQVRAKGEEIQSDDIATVASHSARAAARSVGSPLIVEDAGLFIDSLGGFPGPYSSYAFSKIGLRGVLRTLGDSPDRWAVFRSAVAYCEPEGESRLFEGAVRGWIVTAPSGSHGFGFDPIFAPEGLTQTLAEMETEEKCRVSHRGIAMRKFGAWFSLGTKRD
jgi:XTP/dITP diphosphohydrolase